MVPVVSDVKIPSRVTMTLKGTMQSVAKTEIKVRDFTYAIDEPEVRHGTNSAPTPLENLLGSFLGCTNVITNLAATAMHFSHEGLEMSLSAQLDPRGIYTDATVNVPFPEIRLEVKLKTREPPERVEQLRQAVERKCPVHTILSQAGSRISSHWDIV